MKDVCDWAARMLTIWDSLHRITRHSSLLLRRVFLCVHLLLTLSRKPSHSTTDGPTVLPRQCTVKTHHRSLGLGLMFLNLTPANAIAGTYYRACSRPLHQHEVKGQNIVKVVRVHFYPGSTWKYLRPRPAFDALSSSLCPPLAFYLYFRHFYGFIPRHR